MDPLYNALLLLVDAATVALVARARTRAHALFGLGTAAVVFVVLAALLGAGWSIATYFVVPLLVVEGVGPIEAVKRSFGILRKAWGESLAANFSIGLIVFLASLVALLPAVAGFAMGNVVAAVIGVTITVLAILVISLVSSALHTIIVAALYLYASEGKAPPQFDERLLRAAYSHK